MSFTFLMTIEVFQYVTPCPVNGSDVSKQPSAFIFTFKPSFTFLMTIEVFQYVTPCPVSGSDVSKQPSAFIFTFKPSFTFLMTIEVFQYVTLCPVSGSDVSKQPSAFIFTFSPSNNIPLHLLLKNEDTTSFRNSENRSQDVTASRSNNFNLQERLYSSRRPDRMWGHRASYGIHSASFGAYSGSYGGLASLPWGLPPPYMVHQASNAVGLGSVLNRAKEDGRSDHYSPSTTC